MALTSFDIFVGGLAIGSFSQNKENLQWYIDHYEPDFMAQFIGMDNYFKLIEDIKSTDEEVKKRATEIWDICKFPCAIFIWCYYVNENQEQESGSGNIQMKNENAIVTDSSGKIVRKWNWMVQLTRSASDSLQSYDMETGCFEYNSTIL